MSPRQLQASALVMLCAVLVCRPGDSQTQGASLESDQCRGIVSSVDTQTQTLVIRMQSPTNPKEETPFKFSFDSATKVSKKDGTKVKPEDLKVGSVVMCQTVKNESRLDAIVMLAACTPATCAKTKCARSCKSVKCDCPKS